MSEVVVQEEEWGTGVNPERIEEALRDYAPAHGIASGVATSGK